MNQLVKIAFTLIVLSLVGCGEKSKTEFISYWKELSPIFGNLAYQNRYNELIGAAKARQISDPDFAQALEQEVLPPCEATSRKVSDIKLTDPQLIKMNSELANAFRNECTSISTFMLGVRMHDGSLVVKANEQRNKSEVLFEAFQKSVKEFEIAHKVSIKEELRK